MISLALLLLSCADKAGDAVPSDSGSSDSGSSDSGSSDSGSDCAPARFIAGVTQLPEDAAAAAPLTAGLVEVRFDEGPLIGRTLSSAPLGEDGAYSLALPDAPPADASMSLSAGFDDFFGSTWVVAVWEDGDGDGAFTEGEPVAAFSIERLVAFFDEVPQGAPYPLGWTGVDTGLSGQYAPNRCLLDSTEPVLWRVGEGYPLFYEVEAPPPLLLRGLPARLSLGATLRGETQAAGVVGLAFQYFDDGPTDSVYDTALVDGALGVALSEGPPEDHYYGGDPSWRVTYHLNLVYEDLDGDGAFTQGVDDIEGTTTCLDGERVYSRYTRPVTDWRGFRLLECYGGTAGWRPIRLDPDSGAVIYLSSEDGAALELDVEGCRIDE